MTNTNCLKGIACPECGSLGPFIITVETNVVMHDDGWVETTRDRDDWGAHWGAHSFIRCDSCDHPGVVAEFRTSA